MFKWSTSRIGSQVSSLGTLKGAAKRTLNKSPLPLELKATSRSRSTSNRFTSCTIGIRCALSAYSVVEFHFPINWRVLKLKLKMFIANRQIGPAAIYRPSMLSHTGLTIKIRPGIFDHVHLSAMCVDVPRELKNCKRSQLLPQ
jgi:hypothetical protein